MTARADLVWWLNDAAAILQQNGTTAHADKVREAADLLRADDRTPASLRDVPEPSKVRRRDDPSPS